MSFPGAAVTYRGRVYVVVNHRPPKPQPATATLYELDLIFDDDEFLADEPEAEQEKVAFGDTEGEGGEAPAPPRLR